MDDNGRYLLFLDILGFSKLVDEGNPEKVYRIVKNTLRSFLIEEKRSGLFKTIYFSDTFLFYQESKGYKTQVFRELYNISSILLSELLAKGVSARGSIVFGQFEVEDDFQDVEDNSEEVENDSHSSHQIYFGKALIEAYKAEKAEQWIGITIQPSAWERYNRANSGIIDLLEQGQFWMKRINENIVHPSNRQSHEQADTGNIRSHEQGQSSEEENKIILLLNPFLALVEWYQAEQEGKSEILPLEEEPKFTDGILGFKYLLKETKKYADKGEFSTHDAIKYHATVAFLRKIMGDEMFEWAEDVASLFKD